MAKELIKNETDGHAKFSPSNSGRWLNCTTSMILPEKAERGDSSYATRGTALHAISEDIINGKEASELAESYDGYVPTLEDMEGTVFPYVEYVLELPVDFKEIEQRVYVTEECYGTADCIGYDSKTGTLHVVDLKAGQGVMVSAENNTQLQIYALGAMNKLTESNPYELINKVMLHIVQPGMDNFSVAEVALSELLELKERILTVIEKVKNKDTEYKSGTDICRWCPHKVDCKHLSDMANQAAFGDFENIELSEKLKMIPALKIFISAVEKESFATLDRGDDLPGFKLIQGRGARKWKDPVSLVKALEKSEVPEELSFTAPSLLSVAQLEKVIKKEKLDFDIAEFVERKEGALKIAPETHNAPAVNKTENAAQDFKGL